MTTKHSEFDQYAADYTDIHRANIKASGEEPSYFARYKAQYMARHISGAAGSIALLDFGCGVGNSIPHLKEAFPAAALFGADLSTDSIAIAADVHAGKAEFRVIEENGLPYADGQFDLILVACVFHHIPPAERLHWMIDLKRVLRPSGQIFLFEHNMLNPVTMKAVRECPFDEDAILLPRKELLTLASGAGLANVRSDYIVFFPHYLSFMRPCERLLGWVPLGAQYVVRASH